MKPRYVFRSSITGRYCSQRSAERHPDTTEREQVGIVRAVVANVRRIVGK